MNRRALYREQRVDAVGRVEAAIAEERKAMDVEPSCGPLLVAGYRAMTALGELRDTVDAMPVVDK